MSAAEQTQGAGSPLRVLALTGSLRAKSFNRALVRACEELAPPGLRIAAWDRIGEIPPYDADADGAPEAVADLRDAISASDALLIATPEYNHSVPGVLKNAIDWASRPARRSPLARRPVLLMGAAAGMGGTMRAQMHLREILYSTVSPVFPGPEVYVTFARQKFDDTASLVDEATRGHLSTVLAAFEAWARSIIDISHL